MILYSSNYDGIVSVWDANSQPIRYMIDGQEFASVHISAGWAAQMVFWEAARLGEPVDVTNQAGTWIRFLPSGKLEPSPYHQQYLEDLDQYRKAVLLASATKPPLRTRVKNLFTRQRRTDIGKSA